MAPVAIAVGQGAATVLAANLVHQAARQPVDTTALGAAVLAIVAGFALDVSKRRVCDGIGWAHVREVRSALFVHLLRSNPDEIARRRHGALLQVFVGDLTAQRQWWSDGVPRGITALVMLFALIGWSAWQSALLAAWIAGIALSGIAVGAALLPAMNRAVIEVRRDRGRLSAFASERLAGAATVHAFGQHQAEAWRLDRRAQKLARAALQRAWLTGALRALPHLVTSLILIAVLVGSHGISGTIIVLGTAGLGLRDLARTGELWIPARISHRRIARLMALPAPAVEPSGAQRERAGTGLSLRGVQVAGAQAWVNAWAANGEKVIIEGQPQSVTHLLSVIADQAAARCGQVRWNMLDLVRLTPSRRRRHVGIAVPGLPILAGSNGFNIRYGARSLADEALVQACADWELSPEAAALPENAEVLILLRALVGRQPLLVLDLAGRALREAHAKQLSQAIARHDGVAILANVPPSLTIAPTQTWRIERDAFAVSAPHSQLLLIDAAGETQ